MSYISLSFIGWSIVILVVFYFMTSRGSGILSSIILKLLILRWPATINMKTLSLFPFIIGTFQVSMESFIKAAFDSKLNMLIQSITVNFEWKSWLSTLFNSYSRLIYITFVDVKIEIDGIGLDDILLPKSTNSNPNSSNLNISQSVPSSKNESQKSSNHEETLNNDTSSTFSTRPTKLSMKSVAIWLVKLMKIQFKNIEITINFPKENISVLMKADYATLEFFSCIEDLNLIQLEMNTCNHSLIIKYQNEIAMKLFQTDLQNLSPSHNHQLQHQQQQSNILPSFLPFSSLCVKVKRDLISGLTEFHTYYNYNSTTSASRNNNIKSTTSTRSLVVTDMEVDVQKLLTFYHLYQEAEDTAIDIRLSKGIPLGGKIRLIRGSFDILRVTMVDKRHSKSHDAPLRITLRDLALELSNKPVKDKPVYRDKTMTASFAIAIVGDTTDLAVDILSEDLSALAVESAAKMTMMRGVELVRKVRAMNEGRKIDVEEMTAMVREIRISMTGRRYDPVHFSSSSPTSITASTATSTYPEGWLNYVMDLEWFYMLQSLPALLPVSRHRHQKISKMKGEVKYVTVDLKPTVFKDMDLPETGQCGFYLTGVKGSRAAHTVTSSRSFSLSSVSSATSAPSPSQSPRQSPRELPSPSMTVTAERLVFEGISPESAVFWKDCLYKYAPELSPDIKTAQSKSPHRGGSLFPNSPFKFGVIFDLYNFKAMFGQPPLAANSDKMALEKVVAAEMFIYDVNDVGRVNSGGTEYSSSSIEVENPIVQVDRKRKIMYIDGFEAAYGFGKSSFNVQKIVSKIGFADMFVFRVVQNLIRTTLQTFKATQYAVMRSNILHNLRTVSVKDSLSLLEAETLATPELSESSVAISQMQLDMEVMDKCISNSDGDGNTFPTSILVTVSKLQWKAISNVPTPILDVDNISSSSTTKFASNKPLQSKISWKQLRLFLGTDREVGTEFLRMDGFSQSQGQESPQERSPGIFDAEVSLNSLRINAKQTMRVGKSMDHIISQFNSYSLATRPIEEDLNVDSNEQDHVSVYRSVPTRYTFHSIELALEAEYQQKVIPRFYVVRLTRLTLNVQPRQDAGVALCEIRRFDNTKESNLTYNPISGGMIVLKLGEFKASFIKILSPLIHLQDICLQGPAYMAAVRDHRIRTLTRPVKLLFSPGNIKEQGNDTFSSIDIGVRLCRSDAPSKVYIDGSLDIGTMAMNTDPVVVSYLGALPPAFAQCQLPQHQPNAPLAPVDGLRYWFHGGLSSKIKEFHFDHVLLLNGEEPVVKILANVTNLCLVFRPNCFEWSGSNLSMNVEIKDEANTPPEADMLSPNSYLAKHLRANNQLGTLLSTDENPLLKMQDSDSKSVTHETENPTAKIESQLCLIPQITFSLKHKSLYKGRIHDHHDIYLCWEECYRLHRSSKVIIGNEVEVENEGPTAAFFDKFELFRSRPNRNRWNITLICDDNPSTPLTIWTRLDIMHKIVEALAKTTASMTATDSLNQATSSNQNASTTPQNLAFPVRSRPIPPIQMMKKLDLHVHMKRFLYCSWASSTDGNGLVFLQKQLDVELSLIRPDSLYPGHELRFLDEDGDDDVNVLDESFDNIRDGLEDADECNKLKIDHLSAEIVEMDTYVRNWRIPLVRDDDNTSFFSDRQEEPDTIQTQEAKTVSDVLKLLAPIHMMAHAAKVQAMYMEPAELQSLAQSQSQVQPTTFFQEPDISRRDGKRADEDDFFARSRDRVRQRSRSNTGAIGADVEDTGSQEPKEVIDDLASTHSDRSTRISPSHYRPSMLRFLPNHAVFTPPKAALPSSYQSRNMYRDIAYQVRSRSTVTDGEEEAPNTKIWGLRVLEIRLLWTVNIRDAIFAYGAKYVELFITRSSADVRQMLSKARERRTSKGNARATMMDFLEPTAKFDSPSQPEATEGLHHQPKQPMSIHTNISSPQARDHSFNLLSPSFKDRDLNRRPVSLPPNFSAQTPTSLQSDITTAMLFSPERVSLLDPLSTENTPSFIRRSALARTHSLSRPLKPAVMSAFIGSSQLRPRKPSLRPKSFSFVENYDDSDDEDEVHTIHVDHDKKQNVSLMNNQEDTLKRDSSFRIEEAAKLNDLIAKNPMLPYFIVECVDVQLNFLDEKAEGSVVIVAGAAIVEGKRSVCAIASSHRIHRYGGTEIPSSHPKRRYDVRLRMDGVSLFTVPTNLEGPEPAVHWKNVQSTRKSSYGSVSSTDKITISTSATTASSESNLSTQAKMILDAMDVLARNNSGSRFPNNNPLSETATADSSYSGYGLGSGHRRYSHSSSDLLQLAVKDFKIRASYGYFLDVTVAEAAGMYLYHTEEELVNGFALNLPEICMEIDSAQFFIVLHVVRNVLLSPPPPLIPKQTVPVPSADGDEEDHEYPSESAAAQDKRSLWPLQRNKQGQNNTNKVARSGFFQSKTTTNAFSNTVDINTKRGREEMKLLVEQFLESLKPKEFTYPDGSTLFDADLEKEKEKDAQKKEEVGSGRMSRYVEYCVGRGQWLLKGLKSGGDLVEVGFTGLYGSHCFLEDRSSSALFEVQRFWARNHRTAADTSGFQDATLVLATLGTTEEVCRRCGTSFLPQENTSSSCSFHADNDGEPGEFSLSSTGEYRWTCCGKNWEGAPGCSSRTHICKDIMLSVRADSDPSVVLGGIDVTILKTLELSIYPSSTNELQVQITRSLVDLLHTYFILENNTVVDDEKDGEEVKQQLVGLGGATAPSVMSPFVSRFLSGSSNTSLTSRTKKHIEPDVRPPLPTSSSTRKEVLYVKYLRVGEVSVKVSTAGFPLNVTEYKASVAPFVRHGKVMNWRRLVYKLERHATWSLTKNTATSWFRSMWFSSKAKEKEWDEEDDEARRNALLGGV